MCFYTYAEYFLQEVFFIILSGYRDPRCLCLDNIKGFILNVPSEYKLGFVLLPLKRRHWIALKKINGAFYNLDSKLDSPQLIGKVCIEYIWLLGLVYAGIDNFDYANRIPI